MIVIIPFEGKVMTLLRSPYLIAKRVSEGKYNLSGDAFQMADISTDQVMLLPDDVKIEEGTTLTETLQMRALPIDSFLSSTAEEASADMLGLLLRAAVADGKISDAELLRVRPALEGRLWQPGVAVGVGDVFAFGSSLWKCVQPHTTQGDWSPDLTPALWHKVEIVSDSKTRVWEAGIAYAVGDKVVYPDAGSTLYQCLQAHTAQSGWEPANVPALWSVHP